jgi:hypothetical protein
MEPDRIEDIRLRYAEGTDGGIGKRAFASIKSYAQKRYTNAKLDVKESGRMLGTDRETIQAYGKDNAHVFLYSGHTSGDENGRVVNGQLSIANIGRANLKEFNARLFVVCGCSGWHVLGYKRQGGFGHDGEVDINCGPAWKTLGWPPPASLDDYAMNIASVGSACVAFLQGLAGEPEGTEPLSLNEAAEKATAKLRYVTKTTGKEAVWRCSFKSTDWNGTHKLSDIFEWYKK